MRTNQLIQEPKTKKERKGADLLFLLFIVLLTQGFLPLKLAGVVMIYLLRPQPLFDLKINRTGIFYGSMILLSSLSIMTFIQAPKTNYLAIYGIGLLIWLMCLMAFLQIYHHLKSTSAEGADKTIHYFFLVVATSSVIEIVGLIFGGRDLNPFVGLSAGDMVIGIFANSSVNMIVLGFFIVYYLFKKNYVLSIMAGILALSTTYMSGLIIFFGILGAYIFFSGAISFKMKARLIFLGAFLMIMIMSLSPGNIEYATNILRDTSKGRLPRKIVSFEQTANFMTESPINFLVGAGLGNFSSRLAFFAGGEYSVNFPSDWTYRHENFEKNHFGLWNHEILSKPFNDGTANQPFSVYNQFFGEYGIIGVILLFGVYIGAYYRYYSLLTYGKLMIFIMLGFFVLDYWFEYFATIVIFDWLMTRDWFNAQSLKEVKPIT